MKRNQNNMGGGFSFLAAGYHKGLPNDGQFVFTALRLVYLQISQRTNQRLPTCRGLLCSSPAHCLVNVESLSL